MPNIPNSATPQGLRTLADLVRWGTARLRQSKVLIGHSEDNALDEARSLVLHALHLPPKSPALFASARLLDGEIAAACALIERRIAERIPAAYLIGSAEFAGLRLKSDARALVPRSPIAELIEHGFQPYLGARPVERVLDLCCGGGSIAIGIAMHRPDWQVTGADLSPDRQERRVRVLDALEKTVWNQTRAAEILGISRRTLQSWLIELNIPRPRAGRCSA